MDRSLADFIRRIDRKKARIAVVGLGYVGLPLALTFAKKRFSVLGIEVDKDRLQHIYRKTSYITDVSDKELQVALRSGRFTATADFKVLQEADVVIICVPTPLKRKYSPDISFIKQAVKSISKNIKRGALVILESTTYPGTTEEEILPLLQKNNFKHNRDFYLSFSPERIDPGNDRYPVEKIPKIVGGLSKEATLRAVRVYQNIVSTVVPVSSARTAEAAKLLENTFRLVNIGLIDELAMMAHKMGIDIWEVVHAAATKPFGFMPFYPGPGVGGHCIPKDPLYLYWKAKHFGFRSRFIKLASDTIAQMPRYIVDRVESVLKEKGVPLRKANVLILGVTYKKDIKDLRQSPSLDLICDLEGRGARVAYFDPLVPYLSLGCALNLKRTKLDKEQLRKFDCAVIATDHSCVDYDFILENSKVIFDTRNVYKGKKKGKVYTL